MKNQPETQSAELKIRIHPELKEAARNKAIWFNQSMSEYIRDLIKYDLNSNVTIRYEVKR